MPTQPTFSQWDPAYSLLLLLWHCPRGISYMPLTLSTRRPRSASGSRPTRICCSCGIVSEATHAGQLHGELDSGNDLMVLSTVVTTRLALAKLSKSAPRTCPQRDQDCALLTFTKKMFCSFDAPSKDRVGVSAHNPGTPAGVTTHAFRK